MNREDFKKQMMKVVDRFVDQEVESAELEFMKVIENTPDPTKITRLEVIDSDGRSYTKRDCKIEFSVQDDSKTLKILVEE